jgi:hypothetical protein
MDTSLDTESITSSFMHKDESEEMLKNLSPSTIQHVNQHHSIFEQFFEEDLQDKFTPTKERMYSFEELLRFEEIVQNEEAKRHATLNSAGFYVHSHPKWKKWVAVLKQLPFTIHIKETVAIREREIPGALFRLYPKFENLLIGPMIHQGAVMEFKEYENDKAHYVVEWRMKKDHKYAYLLTVAYTIDGIPYPFDHSAFPTIIIAVPYYLSDVPYIYDSQNNPSPGYSLASKCQIGSTLQGFFERIGRIFKK